MTNIIEKLDALDDAQVAKVEKLIEKLYNKNQKKSTLTKATAASKINIDETPEEAQGFKRNAPTSPIRVVRGRPAPRVNQEGGRGKAVPRNTRAEGRQARSQPLVIRGDRPNLFESMDVAKQHQEDTKLFDKVVQVVPPTERGLRTPNLVSVECKTCGGSFDVAPVLVPGGGYECNDCMQGHKGN